MIRAIVAGLSILLASVSGPSWAQDKPNTAEFWYLAHFGGLVVFVVGLSLLASLVKLIAPLNLTIYFAVLAFGIVVMFLGVLLGRLK